MDKKGRATAVSLENEPVVVDIGGVWKKAFKQGRYKGKRGSYIYKLSGLGESWINDELVPKLKGEEKVEKKEKRGGPRKAIYPKEIQRLKEEKFFGTKKSLDDVIKELDSKGVPTRSKRSAIRNALVRDTRKKDSKLKATKEDDTWIFWVD